MGSDFCLVFAGLILVQRLLAQCPTGVYRTFGIQNLGFFPETDHPAQKHMRQCHRHDEGEIGAVSIGDHHGVLTEPVNHHIG